MIKVESSQLLLDAQVEREEVGRREVRRAKLVEEGEVVVGAGLELGQLLVEVVFFHVLNNGWNFRRVGWACVFLPQPIFFQLLSAVVITLNEEANIGRCLASLAPVADELLVVDSGSTDRTVEIAERMGAKVLFRKFDSFMGQKNFAVEQAAHPFVLSIDADECLDEDLQNSILKVKVKGAAPGYRMKMLTLYCGRWIRHSGWYPDPKLRLFDRRLGRWAGKNPHEKFEFFEKTAPPLLDGHLLHFSYKTAAEHRRKADFYSTLAARFLAEQKGRIWWVKMAVNPVAKWLKVYVVNLGFLDGRAGWQIARLAALETFWKYRKAVQIRRNSLTVN